MRGLFVWSGSDKMLHMHHRCDRTLVYVLHTLHLRGESLHTVVHSTAYKHGVFIGHIIGYSGYIQYSNGLGVSRQYT